MVEVGEGKPPPTSTNLHQPPPTMSFIDAVRLAFQTIRAQKLKSGFPIIGVFIGVMLLIAVVAAVEGPNRLLTDQVAGTLLGVNTFRLREFPDAQNGNLARSLCPTAKTRPRR